MFKLTCELLNCTHVIKYHIQSFREKLGPLILAYKVAGGSGVNAVQRRRRKWHNQMPKTKGRPNTKQ